MTKWLNSYDNSEKTDSKIGNLEGCWLMLRRFPDVYVSVIIIIHVRVKNQSFCRKKGSEQEPLKNWNESEFENKVS